MKKKDTILQIMPNNGEWVAEFYATDEKNNVIDEDSHYLDFPMWALIRTESLLHTGEMVDDIEPMGANGYRLSRTSNYGGVVHRSWIDKKPSE